MAAKTLVFPIDKIKPLLEDGERAWKTAEPRTLYGNKTGPGFWLVGDSGVYLMHNGQTHIRKSGKWDDEVGPKNGFAVVYAKGLDPSVDEDWWQTKSEVFGGDDGVDFWEADSIRQHLAYAEKHGHTKMTVRLSKTRMTLSTSK